MDWFFNIIMPDPREPEYVADLTKWWFRAGMNLGCLTGLVVGAAATSFLWWCF